MSATQLELKLWYYYWSPSTRFRRTVARLTVTPDVDVQTCKEIAWANHNSTIPLDMLRLYSIPTKLKVPLLLPLLEASLGTLSLSELGTPQPEHALIESIVGLSPKDDQLHLLLVDFEAPLNILCWIHGTDARYTFDLNMSGGQKVSSLLRAITTKIASGSQPDDDLTFYKSPFSCPTQSYNEGQPLEDGETTLEKLFSDVPFSVVPCVIIKKASRDRKHHLDWDVVERAIKKQKVAPSSVIVNIYHSLQEKPDLRFLDYRGLSDDPGKLLEGDLPPIDVLFEGFGEFFDIVQGKHTPGRTPVDVTQARVDDFIISMSQVFQNENMRRDRGLTTLNSIFAPVFGSNQVIAPADILTGTSKPHLPRSDGHYLHGRYSIPCFIVEFKNEQGEVRAIPALELASYYQLIVGRVAHTAPDVLRSSRLPVLGITVTGNAITFFGLVYVGSVVYLPLTPTFWCLPIESGGSNHRLLHSAFTAAATLLARIQKHAEVLTDGPLPPPIKRHFFPDIHELSNGPGTTLKFQITEFLSKTLSRHVYKAVSPSSGSFIIKFTRSYSPELHKFCAELGCAPKLFAVQRLPGGFMAIAMEYLTGIGLESLPSQRRITPERRDEWISRLEKLVMQFHAAQLVHGDLRPPNFIYVKDKLMLLDFDWGGKEGEVSYPHTQLNPQLTQGRDMTDLRITKKDDERVLAATLDHIRECVL